MATPPDFSSGAVLTAAQMSAVGCWLVKTQTVGASAVASVTVSNAFSADFNNYRITYSGFTGNTAGASMLFRCVTSGGANNASNWIGNTFYTTAGGAGGLTNSPKLNSDTCEVGFSDTNAGSVLFEVLGPQATRRTNTRFNDCDRTYWRVGAYALENATSYTGFSLLTNAGTFSGGTINVYGFRN